MRKGTILPALTVSLLLGGALSGAETPAPSPQQIEQLIAKLGSAAYRDRVAASRDLDAVGEVALESLRVAARSADAETRRRAGELVERIEERLATARLLAPTPVDLDLQNVTIPEAVAEFNKSAGANVQLQGKDQIGLGLRRVTLRLRSVPFWEALEQLCRSADLHEWDGHSPLPMTIGTVPSATAPPAAPGFIPLQGQIVIRNSPPRELVPPSQIVVLDGVGSPVPVHRAGAVRVRCLPPGTMFPGEPSSPDDVFYPIHVMAEPRLQWQGGASMRVERAIDDRGQTLMAAGLSPAPRVNAEWENVVNLQNGVFISPSPFNNRGPLAIRVRRGAAPAKVLRELSGTVAAQVRVTEALATVERPLATGKTVVRGSAGVTLNVSEISQNADGQIKLHVGLAFPLDVQPAQGTTAVAREVQQALPAGVVFRQQIVVNVGPGIAAPAWPSGTFEFSGLSLLDAQGRRFEVGPAQQSMSQFGPQGWSYDLVLHFRAKDKEQGEPAKLVFTGSRPTTIEVPFSFRDVPLP